MEKRLVTIRLRGDVTAPVNGWVPSGCPGLIITPAATTHRVIDGRYSITHEASGWRIMDHEFSSANVAEMFVNQIASGMTDWVAYNMEEPTIKSADIMALAQKFDQEIAENPELLLGDGADVHL